MPGQEPFDYYGTERSTERRLGEPDDGRLAVPAADARRAPPAELLDHTPFLVVHGTVDAYCTPEGAQAVFDRATGPKEIEWIETPNHIDIYDRPELVEPAVERVATVPRRAAGARAAGDVRLTAWEVRPLMRTPAQTSGGATILVAVARDPARAARGPAASAGDEALFRRTRETSRRRTRALRALKLRRPLRARPTDEGNERHRSRSARSAARAKLKWRGTRQLVGLVGAPVLGEERRVAELADARYMNANRRPTST